MAFKIVDNALNKRLQRNLRQQQDQEADNLTKLSSGNVFTPSDPAPAERALAEKMEFRSRGLAAAKRNVNDAVSLVQTAEAALSEVSNTIVRMKEINLTAASDTISDQERRFLFIEYQALHDELNRIAEVTEYKGIPLLNSDSEFSPGELIFRLDDPTYLDENSDEEDINTLIFDGFQDINTTTDSLGISDVFDLVTSSSSTEGISIEDAISLLEPEEEEFATSYDNAINLLSEKRAVFGSLQTRFQKILDFNDVYQENVTAAKSKIADTDYVKATSDLVAARIGREATTALLAQTSFPASGILNLIKSSL